MKKRSRADGYEPSAAMGTETAAAPGKRSTTAALAPVQAKAAANPISAASSDHAFYPQPEPAADNERPAESFLDSLIRSPVQRRDAGGPAHGNVHELAASGLEGPSSPLPFADTIQRSFGAHDVSRIQAHVGGPAAAAAGGMGAEAYATGHSVAFASEPDLHTAAHEAAHVVQQAGGVSLKGGVGEAGDRHEHHADQVADLVVQGKSAESLLSQYAPASGPATLGSAGDRVQRREIDSEQLPESESTEAAPAEAEAASEEEREVANDQVPADAFAGDVPVADPSVTDTAEPSSIPPAETSAAVPTPSTPARAPSAPASSPAVAAAPSAAAAPERTTAMSPERVKRLLHGQYMGLRKLYVAGKLDQGQLAEKMLAYDRKLNGGMASPEGTVLLLRLLAETSIADVERQRRQQAKKPLVASGAPSSSGNTGARTAATPAPSAGHGNAPVLAPVPSAAVTDERLSSLVAALRSPEAEAIAGALAGLQAKARTIPKDRREEKGTGRDELVAGIGALRAQMDRFKGSGLDATKLQAFRAAVYRAIQDLSPFYFQSRNIDILEKPPASETRTCNITCLSMALESLGKSAEMFKGDRAAVLAAARFYQHKIVGDAQSEGAIDATKGAGASWEQVASMRLPDFMELVAISVQMKGDVSDDGVKAGAKAAWNTILKWGELQTMAQLFGVSCSMQYFDASGTNQKKRGADSKRLRAFGDDNRMPVEHMLNNSKKKDQAKYDEALADTSLDDQFSLDQYRQFVVDKVGSDLSAGSAVIVGLANHFVRLQAVHEDHIIVDDPARDTRSATKLSYEQARAMGYFHMRFVLR